MHDRANILISPSSLGRLVVLAYLHWRVANATNLNRVGNIGLHQGCELSMQLKNQTKIFCCCFILFFFHYLYYLSIVVSLLFILSLAIRYHRLVLHIIYFRLSLGIIYLCYLSFLYLLHVTVHCDLFFFVVYLF